MKIMLILNSDVNIASGFKFINLYQYLNKLEVSSKPGTKFNYNTAESNVIGGIVREQLDKIFYLFRRENMETFWNGVRCLLGIR